MCHFSSLAIQNLKEKVENDPPTVEIDGSQEGLFTPKDRKRFDALKMHVFTQLLRKYFTGEPKVQVRLTKSTIYGSQNGL